MLPSRLNSTRIIAILLTLGIIGVAHAQPITVIVKIQDSNQRPVPYATVRLVPQPDSSGLLQLTADSLGKMQLSSRVGLRYQVTVTAVNFQPLEKDLVILPARKEYELTLLAAAKTLGDVVVRSSKPLIRQEDDKTIVDPENLAATSTNGYEILEKTPGLFVDQDGNVYIASTSPAMILINGRETKMSTADIATMLKSLPPQAIQSIEIVRTPSARYDASGSGGIVNIILRKGVKPGMNGSVNAGMQQGIYGNKFAGFTINNNNGQRTTSFNINYSRRNSFETIVTNRLFATDSLLQQQAETVYPSDNYYAGYSTVFSAGSKWEIDLSSSLAITKSNNQTSNLSQINRVSNQQLISDNQTAVTNDGRASNFKVGANTKYRIDTTGSEWIQDFFYSYSRNSAVQEYQTDFIFPLVLDIDGSGNSINDRHLAAYTSDLKWKAKHRLTVETGWKSSFLWFRNTANYFIGQGSGQQKDPGRTNTFRYDENINAFYLQGSKTLGKDAVVKLGTRIENTNMEGHQLIPSDTSFRLHRTDFFPYVYLSKKLIAIAGFELRAYLVYRRTINRPVYEQLNPFSRYVDQYLSERGNPALRPQFNNNYEANVSVNETPLLAIGVNQTKDIFTNVIYQADSSRTQAFRTYDNLGSNKEFYLRGLGAIPPGHRYFFVLGGQYNHNFYQGLYENKPLSFRKGSWTLFTYHSFKLDSKSQITLNGFVRWKGQLQFYELSSFGALNASINRQLMQRKLTITVSANDLFRTLRYDFRLQQGSVNAQGYRLNDSRRFGINIRYNFGIRKKEETGNLFNVESPEKTN